MSERKEDLFTTERIRLNASFSRAPLIPARPNGKPVIFYSKRADGRKLTIRIGAISKNRSEISEAVAGLCPSLHIELWHLILVLLSFYKERPQFDLPVITPTFGEVWRRFTCSNVRPSRNQLESFSKLLDELNDLVMAVEVEGMDKRHCDVVHYDTKFKKLNFGYEVEGALEKFTFNPDFIGCILFADPSQDVRLDVLASVTSRYVRAGYLWLPARASHYEHPTEAEHPDSKTPKYLGEMAVYTSAEFMRGLGEPDMPKWERKRLLKQNGRSILAQLHSLPMMNKFLRLGVCWWDGADDLMIGTYCYHSDDWMPGITVGSWKNSNAPAPTDGALISNFLAGGGSREAYYKLIAKWKNIEVDPEVLTRMERLGVENIEAYMPLYQQSVCILGEDAFRDLISNLGVGKSRKPDKGYLFRGIIFGKVKTLAKQRTDLFSK